MVIKVISGGQTGADTGALMAARHMGVPTGGWGPPDLRHERGAIDPVFGLTATPQERSTFGSDIPRSLRTEWNVRDSDGTMVMGDREQWDMGTQFTWNMCQLYDKPCFLADFQDPGAAVLWIITHGIYILNVAGPRESEVPGVEALTSEFMKKIIIRLSA